MEGEQIFYQMFKCQREGRYYKLRMEQTHGLNNLRGDEPHQDQTHNSRIFQSSASLCWENCLSQENSSKVIALIAIGCIMLFFNFVFYLTNHDARASTPANYLVQTHTETPNAARQDNAKSSTQTVKPQIVNTGKFPQIFWIYTENEFDTESMTEQIYLEYFNSTAHRFGYQVRTVNSWNSYDWLTENTIYSISKAMQNSKVDQTIHSVLKLALLMEHGGILVNQFDIGFLGDDFRWVEDMFDRDAKQYQERLGCDPAKAYLFMMSVDDQVYGTKYIDPFIAAMPGSLVLREAFDMMISFIMTGEFPFNSDFDIIKKNTELGVNFIPNALEETINMVLYKYKRLTTGSGQSVCNKYGMQSRKHKDIIFLSDFTETQKKELLLTADPQAMLEKLTGTKEVRLVRALNSGLVPKTVSDLIDNVLNNRTHFIEEYQPGSLLFRILDAPKNKEVFLEPFAEREIELCVIITRQLSKPEVDASIRNLLLHQTYAKWKQIVFVQNTQLIQKSEDSRLIFLNSSSNPVRNIEIAATKHCGKQSYAVLLNPGEKFSSLNALAEIAKATTPRDIVGAFIALDEYGRVRKPRQDLDRFHRGRDGIVNPKISRMEQIINHMRIFSVQSFRYIPQFDLRDIHGRYFKDRLIFLMTLLEMIRTEINLAHYFYVVKRYSSLWNVPRRAVFISEQIKIKTSAWEKVDMDQLQRTRARLECEEVQESIHNILLWKIPFSKMLAFNNGDEFTPVDQKKGPDLIPKVIHQVWLGTSDMPPAKKYFYRKTRLIYPNYEIKLWREENITRENFPLTYDLLVNLINFNKHSPYNKLATVTDIIRHELLYHQGGFWKDAGMNMLRPIFDKFTKYKIVIAVDKTFRYRWLQGMCFFANTPRIENMWRITNYRNLNRMRIYHSYASSIAGPIDFRQFIVGQEEYDPEFLCMPYDTFYPAQVSEHPEKDLCTKRAQQLKDGDQYQISESGWYLLSNCSELYPYSYAVQHNRFGDSWARRRQI